MGVKSLEKGVISNIQTARISYSQNILFALPNDLLVPFYFGASFKPWFAASHVSQHTSKQGGEQASNNINLT